MLCKYKFFLSLFFIFINCKLFCAELSWKPVGQPELLSQEQFLTYHHIHSEKMEIQEEINSSKPNSIVIDLNYGQSVRAFYDSHKKRTVVLFTNNPQQQRDVLLIRNNEPQVFSHETSHIMKEFRIAKSTCLLLFKHNNEVNLITQYLPNMKLYRSIFRQQ